MYKLWVTIKKDFWLLTRDRVALVLMFGMPVVLVIVITSVQNSTFELVNDNKVQLLFCNKDSGAQGRLLLTALEKMGIFKISSVAGDLDEQQISGNMHEKNALIMIVVPKNFSFTLSGRAKNIAANALRGLGLGQDSGQLATISPEAIRLYYHPVLQESFRQSILGALNSAVQLLQSKQIVQNLYFNLNEKEIPDSLENEIVHNEQAVTQIPVSRDGSRNIPNATQHNIPAWTIFAMFFVVIPLGSSVIREKQNGSFLRLKTLPTSYLVSLLSKQITYLGLTLAQAIVIFSIGAWLFPYIGLPALQIPKDILGLLIVTLITGYCATSFAICIGVFAQTQEQCNSLGAVSVVILAAIGGLLVPSFAMPASFGTAMKISPLHWALEAYYGLFLEGGKLKDILLNILSLLVISLVALAVAISGLRRKNLI